MSMTVAARTTAGGSDLVRDAMLAFASAQRARQRHAKILAGMSAIELRRYAKERRVAGLQSATKEALLARLGDVDL